MLKYRLRKIGRKKIIFWSATLLIFVISMSSIIRYYASYSSYFGSDTSNSGTIIDNKVVVNEMEADRNYYESLNYTKLTSTSSLPEENTIYTDSNLAKIEVVYDGTDVNDTSAVGQIDSDGRQGLIYYKYYPIEGGKIKIELIDNPFEIRPSGKAFNGWVCNTDKSTSGVCDTSVLSYDEEYYVRYITVEASSAPITVYLNVSWTNATVKSDVSEFSDTTMKDILITSSDAITLKGLTSNTTTTSTYLGTYLTQRYYVFSQTVNKGRKIPSYSYYSYTVTGRTSTTYYFYQAGNNTNCPTGGNYSNCTVYSIANNGDTYDSTKTYYTCGTTGGSLNPKCTQVSSPNTEDRYDTYTSTDYLIDVVGKTTETPINDLNMVSYYYKSGSSSSSGYYDETGKECSDDGYCAITSYKLIQNSDTSISTYNATSLVNITFSNLSDYYTSAGIQYKKEDDTGLLYAVDTAGNEMHADGSTDRVYLIAVYNGNEYKLAVENTTDQNIYFVESVTDDGVTITVNPLYEDGAIKYLKSVTIDSNYKYLVTRDTNIYGGSGITGDINKPLTVEGGNANNITISNDVRFANKASINSSFNADAYNVKISRTVLVNGITVYGTNGQIDRNSRFIVEGGTYDTIVGQNGNNANLERQMILGSDYDKALSNDSILIVNKRVVGTTSTSFTSSSVNPVMDITVKSGSYGMNVAFSKADDLTATYGEEQTDDSLKISTNTYATYDPSVTSYYTYGIVVSTNNDNPTYTRSTSGTSSTTYTYTAGCVSVWNLKYEGGKAFNILGGFISKSGNNSGAVTIYMTGGYVNTVFGGVQNGTTYGNRVVSISGGNVGNAVVGGNNGYGFKTTINNTKTYSFLNAKTLVYVGGSTTVGYKLSGYDSFNNSIYGVEQRNSSGSNGNVYGASLGNERNDTDGDYDVLATHVIINGGTINGSVYGGGNYGRVRNTDTTTRTSTNVEVHGGVISDDVYGASNFNGFGVVAAKSSSDDFKKNVGSLITTIDGGTINGNVYGANNGYGHDSGTWFDVVANVTVNISGDAVIKQNVYTGGSGSHTYVFGNTTLNINGGTIMRSAYGGGALGDVNCSPTGSCYNSVRVNSSTNITSLQTEQYLISDGGMLATKVNVSGGTVKGDVFGGGRGKTNCDDGITCDAGQWYDKPTSSIETDFADSRGIIEVRIKDGANIEGAVYGGNDARGDLGGAHNEGDQYVDYTSHIRDTTLSKTTMHVAVLIEGGNVGEVYGAGKGAQTISRYTYVKVTGGNIGSVFGGSNEGIASDTLVEINGGTITNVYGGSNNADLISIGKTGVDKKVIINIHSPVTITNSVKSIYTNATSSNSKLIIDDENAKVDYAYGGGRLGAVDKTYTTVNSGTIGEVYGGGESADITTATSVLVKGGTIDSVFGGSNKTGVVTSSDVIVEDGTIDNVYGGNNEDGETQDAYVAIIDGTINDCVYGGGLVAPITTKTNVLIYGGTIKNDVYGGGKQAGISNSAGTALSAIDVAGGTMTDVYGGSYYYGDVDNTNVLVGWDSEPNKRFSDTSADITRGTITISTTEDYTKSSTFKVNNIYGGNNAGGHAVNTNVYMLGNTVNDIFGGGNNAEVTKSTFVYMADGIVQNVYGGGNLSYVGESESVDGKFVSGNASGLGTTTVYVANGTINENVYGSGNASYVYGTTNVYVGGEDVVMAPGTSTKVDSVYFSLTGLTTKKLTISGSVFGGSETNSDESAQWNYDYMGVAGNEYGGGDTNIYVYGEDYNSGANLTIKGSLFGEGNNSTIYKNGTANIYVNKYGTSSSIQTLKSIQRATNVYLTDSVLELTGEHDRTLPTKYYYGFVLIDDLYLLGSSGDNTTGTTLYMNAGCDILKGYNSGSMKVTNTSNPYASYKEENFNAQTTTVSETDGDITEKKYSDNKLFMHTNVIFAVANTAAPEYTDDTVAAEYVKGMTYLGMYTISDSTYVYGIYDISLAKDSTISSDKHDQINDNAYTFVYGYHEFAAEEQKKTNGFYTHTGTVDEAGTTYTVAYNYVGVSPLNSNYYKWVLGSEPLDIEVSLQATKSTVDGAVLKTIDLKELKEAVEGNNVNWKDATMTIQSVDASSFAVNEADVKETWDVSLVDRKQIPAVNENTTTLKDGNTVSDANKYFALSVGTTTSGWLDNYKTNIYSYSTSEISGTNFCTDTFGKCSGSQDYTYDSTRSARSLSFWLYYSKNLDFDISSASEDESFINIDLGQVYIYTEFNNPNADPTLTTGTVPVRIVVDISMNYNKTDKYGTAITAGKKYEVFNSSATSITSNGSFSIYQTMSIDLHTDAEVAASDPKKVKLWSANTLYAAENYRYLRSDFVFPEGTRITMLDLKNNEQYYYDVSATSYSSTKTAFDKLSSTGEQYASYRLEDFIKMGNDDTSNLDNYYNDDMSGLTSKKYYTNIDGKEVATEEFIFFVDFSHVSDSDVDAYIDTSKNHYFYMEIAKDVDDGSGTNTIVSTIVGPTGVPQEQMKYTITKDVNTSITSTGGFVDGTSTSSNISFYSSDTPTLQIGTDLIIKDSTGKVIENIVDSTYDDYKLGAKITIMQPKKDEDGNLVLDEDGKQVYETVNEDLFGTVVKINGKEYYPQTDGSVRLTLAGRMTEVLSNIDLDFSNSSLNFGDYKLVVETFASYDGLYYGDFTPTVNEYYFTLLNNEYGIDVSLPPVQVTRDSNTGQDKNGSLDLTYTLKTKNGLANPNVKVHLERRTYNSYDDLTYEDVSLSNFASSLTIDDGTTNILDSCYASLASGDCYIYNLTNLNNTIAEQEFAVKMVMKEGPTAADKADPANAGWKSGTYRLVFDMYDGDTKIGSVYEYLIIRSLDIDEDIEGS